MPSPSTRAAFFLGAGIHSCLGNGIDANLKALRQAPEPPKLQANCATGETLKIPYKLLSDSPLRNLEQRLYRVVIDVVNQALREASLTAFEHHKMALYVGSSSFDVSVTEAQFQRELEDENKDERAVSLRNPSIAKLADYLVQELGLRGEDYSFNTACTGSANALLTAAAQVEAGIVDHALIVGVELHNDVSALGFHGLGLLTRSVMKPFDSARDGLVLGEGVSALVIGRAAATRSQSSFYLRGGANLSDTYSISAVGPGGSTIAEVMEQALLNAGIEADQVDCLKVHGTASLSNDEAEAAGMHQVFSRMPALCALKPFIGHTLGACGLNELILFYRAIETGFLVATPGISATGGELNIVLNQQHRSVETGNFMLNYFGFGGNNTSLLVSNQVGSWSNDQSGI